MSSLQVAIQAMHAPSPLQCRTYPFPAESPHSLLYRTLLILSQTASEFISTPITSAASSGKVNFASFTHFHELWRWVEYLIWRAVTLGVCI
jgi:hypothetical protein